MTEERPKQPTTISREDLYDQVWSTPMMQLAARYGISGNGLAKVCRRLAIPYPGRGYWARKAAGQPVKQTPLPQKPGRAPFAVTIRPTPPVPPAPVLSPELQVTLAAARDERASSRKGRISTRARSTTRWSPCPASRSRRTDSAPRLRPTAPRISDGWRPTQN